MTGVRGVVVIMFLAVQDRSQRWSKFWIVLKVKYKSNSFHLYSVDINQRMTPNAGEIKGDQAGF